MNNEPTNFTEAQCLVIAELVRGKSNAEIAKALGIAVKTVKAHLTAIYKASGCTNCRQFLVGYYTDWAFPK